MERFMQVVTLNNKVYLASSTDGNTAFGAFAVGNGKTLGTKDFKSYIQAKNVGELLDISFGNAVYMSRPLTTIEQGSFTMVETAMDEARKTAIPFLENARLDQLLGE